MEELWEEIGATSEDKYQQAKTELKKLLARAKSNLAHVESFEDFLNFCEAFTRNNINSRPIEVIKNKEIDHKLILNLEKYSYPADFLQWHKSFGNIYLWLESTKISQTIAVIEELQDSWSGLLTDNNFLFITSDGGGNGFYYSKLDNNKIYFLDHDEVITSSESDDIEEIYSEFYDFWIDEEGGVNNPKKLDVNKIFKSSNQYDTQSEYITNYIKKHMKEVKVDSFLNFLIIKTKEGFKNFLNRHDI